MYKHFIRYIVFTIDSGIFTFVIFILLGIYIIHADAVINFFICISPRLSHCL